MENEQTNLDKNKNPFKSMEKDAVTNPINDIDGIDSFSAKKDSSLSFDDEIQKLEYKINNVKESLSNLEKKIDSAKNIDDAQRLEFLESKKQILLEELKNLNACYYNHSRAFKIMGFLKNISDKKNKFVKLIKNILVKIFPWNSILRISDINKNIDELADLRIPFGGITSRYDNLSKYINKANIVHSKISAHIKKSKRKTSDSFQNKSVVGNLLDISQ